MPALVPFELIGRIVDTFERFLTPPLIPMKIETSYDTVTLILNEMLDDGYPYLTETDFLKDLVPSSGLISKLTSSVSRNAPQLSTTPWRRSKARHTKNELFVDMVETLYTIVPAPKRKKQAGGGGGGSGSAFYSNPSTGSRATTKPLLCRAEGTIFVTSNLSGVPDIRLMLDLAGHVLDFPSFHPCVRFQKWQDSNGTLSFVPPDGKSLLASYTVERSGQGIVFADLATELGPKKDEFEVRVWTLMSRDIKTVDNLFVRVVCDGDRARAVKNLRVTSGDFHLGDSGVGEWRFSPRTSLGWNATLRGRLDAPSDEATDDDASDAPIFPTHLELEYSVTGALPSGIKVQSLRIDSLQGVGEGVKPFKGIRYVTNIGQYVVR